MGTERVRQRAHVQGVAVDEDRERGAGQLLGAQVREDAGADQVADARGHRGQSAESRRDRANPQTLSQRYANIT